MRYFLTLIGLLLAACGDTETSVAPSPAELTREALGHYCNMIVADHPGPKGQIHLHDSDQPVWFSSARDTVAFTRLPEESKAIAAIYVNDMGQATNWDSPEPGTWIKAEDAWYVIESARRGGMGAPEAVPFGARAAADEFATVHGGEVVAWAEIPDSYILEHEADPEMAMDDDMSGHDGHAMPAEHGDGHAMPDQHGQGH